MSVYFLALELKMTVSQLMESLTYSEYVNWIKFFTQRGEEPEPEPLSPKDFEGLF